MPVEDRQLDGLLRPDLELVAGLVELLDLVDGGEVGAAQLGELAAEREARSRPAGRARASASAAQMFAIDDFGSPSRRASSLGPAAAPPFSASRSRIAAARVTAGASEFGLADGAGRVRHDRAAPDRATSFSALVIRASLIRPASMLNRVPHLDCDRVRCHTVQPTAACSICWTERTDARGGSPVASRYRLVAAAITAIFIATACPGRPHPSAPASAPAPAPRRPAPSRPRAHRPPARTSPASTVNLLTFNGPQIAEPLQRRAPDFEALTGAKINVVAVGFQEIYDKAILDLSTGHEQLRRVRVQPAVARRLRRPRLPRGPQRARRRATRSSTGRTSGRSSATSTRPTAARPTRSRSTATSTWSTTAPT